MIEKISLTILSAMAIATQLFSDSAGSTFDTDHLVAKKSQYDQQTMSPGDCSDMSQDEQDFAAQLNDVNAMMFCSKMTSDQRQKAMKMTGMRGPSGTKMTPDDAVQNVMKKNGMQDAGKNQRGSNACPVQ